MKVIKVIVILLITCEVNPIKFFKSVRPLKLYEAYPCTTEDIVSKFFSGLENGYNVTIKRSLDVATDVRLVFDSEAAVILDKDAKFSSVQDSVFNIFNIILLRSSDSFKFTVRGQPAPYSPPYLISLKINGDEYCKNYNLTYFEEYDVGVQKRPQVPNRYCGRRKIWHTELIVNGQVTKPGNWPWHTAIYRYEKAGLRYVCGGTLINKYFVLTAAHCTTSNGIPVHPEVLGVIFGKYNLYGSDISLQERQVLEVIVHDEFTAKKLQNDISLLKLRTEVTFNNYVQPACLWYDEVYFRLPKPEIFGTVVGWGYDSSDSLSSTLHEASMPQIDDLQCVYTNPLFYGNFIRDGKKFCAGYLNKTSACNGDSGGGFMVFVPDLINPNSTHSIGAWYVKGIVSVSLSRTDVAICDPNSYAVFTDVSKYLKWIKDYIT